MGLLSGEAKFDISTLDEIELIYNAPLRKTENSITYKARPTWIVTNFDMHDYFNDPRKIVLNSEGFEKTYIFKDGLLNEVRLEDPALLYNGLQDNLDQDVLTNMSVSDTTVYLNLRDNMVSELSKAFESSSLAITLNDQTGEAVMDSNVLFAVDSSTLTEEGKSNIDQFMKTYADVLTADENIKHVKEICFEGHTDSTGSYEYNLILSQKRAEALMQYCLTSNLNGLTDEQRKVLQKISTAKGYSFSDPVLTEDGKEDKAASRRASIKIYVQKDSSEPVTAVSSENNDTQLSTVNVEVSEFERGVVTGNTFTNKFSGLKLTVPDRWQFGSDEYMLGLMGINLNDVSDESVLTRALRNQTVIYDVLAQDPIYGSTLLVIYDNLAKETPDPSRITLDDMVESLEVQHDSSAENGKHFTLTSKQNVTLGAYDYLKLSYEIHVDKDNSDVMQYYYTFLYCKRTKKMI